MNRKGKLRGAVTALDHRGRWGGRLSDKDVRASALQRPQRSELGAVGKGRTLAQPPFARLG